MKAGQSDDMIEYTAGTVYYVVLLFFLPAILNTLKIYGITDALQKMLIKAIVFLPNLLAGLVILLIGLWIAGIVRRAVCGLLVISRLDSFGEKIGISKCFGNHGLAEMIGITAYVLIIIPTIISALTALNIDVLSRSIATLFDRILNVTGELAAAALILFTGILLGNFTGKLIARL